MGQGGKSGNASVVGKSRTATTRLSPGTIQIDSTAQSRPISRKLQTQLATCFSCPDRVLFLDIETTGLSHYYDEITIVGWSFNGCANTIVKGQNTQALFRDAANAVALVTFNGIRFDLKFIEREYPDIAFPSIHIDLMYLCRRLGLKGGQKAIEKNLGISYRNSIGEMDGAGAVLLWHRYLRGDVDALRELILYNRIDIATMGAILDIATANLDEQMNLFSEDVRFEDWSAPSNWTQLPKVRKPSKKVTKPHVTFGELFGSELVSNLRVVGIDLTGSEKRASGWCLLEGSNAHVKLARSDDELIADTIQACPKLVSIDSPLCLPAGRVSVEDNDPGRSKYGIMRHSERELKRRGINVYPCLIPSMQKLTARGMRLAQSLREQGVPVIESYPGAAQDIMRIPRKGRDSVWLKRGLEEFGISGEYQIGVVSHDELDAITSALVGTFHLAGMTEALGSSNETPLIIPKRNQSNLPLVVGISGPIAAGKTTLAHLLERRGFVYTRFSLVLDEMLVEMQIPLTREMKQKLGAEINATGRQRWLCEKTIERVDGASMIVVDGLRFPEDYATLVENFGVRFRHLYVHADKITRRTRYTNMHDKEDIHFDAASEASVESQVFQLKTLADDVVDNEKAKLHLEQQAEDILKHLQGAQPCLYQS